MACGLGQASWNVSWRGGGLGGGVGLVWVNAIPGRPDPRSVQPSLRDSTGLGAAGCRGLEACRTADSPRCPQWHTREEGTAVLVCVVCALLGCLWVWGVCVCVPVGWFVAWCSRPRQGGSGHLTLSPPGE